MKHILYIGGFEMPNKNAAAQRVLSIAKALREGGYDTLFYGITKSEDYVGCSLSRLIFRGNGRHRK